MWSTLKTILFAGNSSLPPTRTNDGSVTYDPSKMAKVFLQNKQNDQEINLSPNRFPNPKFNILLAKIFCDLIDASNFPVLLNS